jgi:5-(carboxyamino)imidazole ribonucleotide mutase
MTPSEVTPHLLVNVQYRFKNKILCYQPCHCMKSILKPRKRRLKSDQDSFSGHHLVSIVAPSIELFNKIHEACSVLENFGIPYETTIAAAHRSPIRAIKYASNLEVRGIEVVLACGTGSAHLPGMIASLTNLPVIGIPLVHTSSLLGGTDSLLSMIQMPQGVPVATVGIDSAYNAALLACQILSLKHHFLRERLQLHKLKMEEKVDSDESYLRGS